MTLSLQFVSPRNGDCRRRSQSGQLDTRTQFTGLFESPVFVDLAGDGLLNQTAWAGVGNGVLFYDPDDTGEITDQRQYVFTEWDPTATSDIEALRSVFDSNGDGVFDADDDEWSNFKVMVTNADGSLEAKSLSAAGVNIASIDLTADATNIELPDGSVGFEITSETTADGSSITNSYDDTGDKVLRAAWK